MSREDENDGRTSSEVKRTGLEGLKSGVRTAEPMVPRGLRHSSGSVNKRA